MKEIQDQLARGECEAIDMAQLKPPGTKLSAVWESYKVVRNTSTKVLCHAAVCVGCRKVLSYHDRRTDTSTLSRHLETCSHSPSAKRVTIDPPREAKEDFKKACAHFCAIGLRPPETFNDEGIIVLIQKAIDIGVAYAQLGRLDAKKLVPCPSTIKKCIEEEAENARKETTNEVLPAIREFRCAATTDAYTDDFKKEKYIALTLHYIHEWTVKNRLLFIACMDGEASTSDNLLQTLQKIFEESGVHPQLMERLRFVTDSGSDIKKALENYLWFYCMAHALNIVLKTALSVKYSVLIAEMLAASQEAAELVEKCNSWVREARTRLPKGSSFLEKLKCSIPQSQGHLPALRSVDLCYKKIQNAVGNGLSQFSSSDLDKVKELAEFLSPFDLDGKWESAPQISSSRYPAIKKHLEINTTDSPMITAIKESTAVHRTLLPMKLITVIDSCKELVTYLKRSGISQKLEHTVKQEVSTRWNSITDMLISVDLEWENIKEQAAGNKGARSKVSNVHIEQARSILGFLAPFAKCTDKLQGQNYPTIQYALLAFERLLDHCAPNPADSEELAAVREKAYQLMCEKVLIKEDHKVAAFLCPLLKHLSVCATEEEKKEVHEAERRRLKVISDRDQASSPLPPPSPANEDANSGSSSAMGDGEESPPPPVAVRLSRAALTDSDLFGSYLFTAQTNQAYDEVDLYLAMLPAEVGQGTSSSVDPLLWWKTQGAARFPKLSKLAIEVFALPAISAASERTFSDLGELMTDKRTSLHPKTVSDTLCLRDFLRSRS